MSKEEKGFGSEELLSLVAASVDPCQNFDDIYDRLIEQQFEVALHLS